MRNGGEEKEKARATERPAGCGAEEGKDMVRPTRAAARTRGGVGRAKCDVGAL